MIKLDVIVLDLFYLINYSLILGMECLWVEIFDVIFMIVIVVLMIVIVIVMRLFVVVMFWLLDFDDVI